MYQVRWNIKNYISHLESPSTIEKGGLIYMIVLRLELFKAIKDKNISKIYCQIMFLFRMIFVIKFTTKSG